MLTFLVRLLFVILGFYLIRSLVRAALRREMRPPAPPSPRAGDRRTPHAGNSRSHLHYGPDEVVDVEYTEIKEPSTPPEKPS